MYNYEEKIELLNNSGKPVLKKSSTKVSKIAISIKILLDNQHFSLETLTGMFEYLKLIVMNVIL